MTQKEMNAVINKIYTVYPNFAFNRDLETISKTWLPFFENLQKEKVMDRLNKWILESAKAPSICDLAQSNDWRKDYETIK